MTPTNHKPRYRRLLVALGITLLMLVAAGMGLDQVTPELMRTRLVWPLIRLLCFIGIGLTVGQVIESAGWTRNLGKISSPLFHFSKLGSRCSAAFVTAFISGTAANAMLYNFWQERQINKHQLTLTYLANQFPAYFLHLPTTVFIVLPLTGWAGVHYFLLTFAAAMVRLMMVLFYGNRHPVTQPEEIALDNGGPVTESKKQTPVWLALKQKLPQRLMNIATYVVPIYVAVFLLNSMGAFEWARQWMAKWVVTAFIPVEALSLVVLSFAAEFTSGFATAGALMSAGVITTKQTVLALLIGNIVAFPIRALRHQLPRLLGIFTFKAGFQLLLLGQGFRMTSLILAGVIYYIVF